MNIKYEFNGEREDIKQVGVSSQTFTQYYIECDDCHNGECCPSSALENVHSKQQAIKWADMHRTKDGKILCDKCYEKYKSI